MLYLNNSPLIWRVIFIQLSINWTCYICTVLSVTLLLLSLNAPQQKFLWQRLARRHILFLSFDPLSPRQPAGWCFLQCHALSFRPVQFGWRCQLRLDCRPPRATVRTSTPTDRGTDRKTDRQILWLVKQLPSEGFSCFCLCLNDLVLMFGRNTDYTWFLYVAFFDFSYDDVITLWHWLRRQLGYGSDI